MKTPRFGLKARFVAACLILVSISTAGYFVAVAQYIEFLEAELQELRLVEELAEYVSAYELDPQATGPRGTGLSSYAVPKGGNGLLLPEPLRGMKPGLHDDIHINGREVAAARADVAGARLYVVLDMEPVEQLELRFMTLAWASVLVSWAAAVALALWLARLVLRPVTQLASLVAAANPGDGKLRLEPVFGDREIGQIAKAFDRFMERIEAFISREQAFTEDASHELRTPLAVIDSTVQLLVADVDLSESARTRIQRILRAVQQMQMLIEAMLFLAREEGSYPAEQLPMHQLAREIVDSQRELIGTKPVELKVSAAPTVVHAPRGMAACVIANLLLNAIHYTERGSIELEVKPAGLAVQDSGIGIPPADLGRIFERRFRGAHSRGLGLGLYLVKRICDRLGWTVRVSSVEGSGTRIDVLFG
jgi:signal transduction histidine kinase